jgi:hypothetical protein
VDGKTTLNDIKGAIAGENCVYGLFNAGVCRIDSNGVKIISAPIANEFRQLNDDSYYGILTALNETDGIFLLKAFPEDATDPTWFCYNIRTNAWTKWDFETGNYPFDEITAVSFFRTSYSENAKLHFVYSNVSEQSELAIETRLNDADNYNLQYIDGDFAESTATLSGAITGGTYGVSRTLVLSGAFSGGVTPAVGDIIYAGSLLNMNAEPSSADYFGLITTVNSSTSYTVKQMSVKATGSISNGATVRLLRAYTTRVAYDVNSPSNLRHYRDVTYMFKNFRLNSPDSIVYTDQSSTEVNSDILFNDTNNSNLRLKRVLFPSGMQYANAASIGFRNTEAGTYAQLLGVGLTYEDVSERNSK